jgi:hypothetical protein
LYIIPLLIIDGLTLWQLKSSHCQSSLSSTMSSSPQMNTFNFCSILYVRMTKAVEFTYILVFLYHWLHANLVIRYISFSIIMTSWNNRLWLSYAASREPVFCRCPSGYADRWRESSSSRAKLHYLRFIQYQWCTAKTQCLYSVCYIFVKLFFNLRSDLTLMFIWLTGIMTNISDYIQVVTDSKAVAPAAEVPWLYFWDDRFQY